MARRIATLSQLVKRALRRPEAWKHKPITRPRAYAYIAKGGPYDGRVICLVDGNSACLRFRDGSRGRYFAAIVTRGEHRGETVWKPAP